MPPSAASVDDLVALIGTPPTAQGIAAAILAAIAAEQVDALPDPIPDDHGLHPDDSAVTGVPRDETSPTPGVDLPADDTTPLPPETLALTADDSADDPVPSDPSPPTPAADTGGDATSQPLTKRQQDQAKVDADQAQLAEDGAALAADPED